MAGISEQMEEVPPPKVIEVERKFALSEDSERKLNSLGATLLKESQFTDVYYDTSNYTLTSSDHWLRKRDNNWELKCPPAYRQNDAKSSQYTEHTSEGVILQALIAVLQKEQPLTAECSNLQQLLQKAGLNEFAQYTTQRKTYVLDSFTIDLDLTDFGFQVGEIEVLVVDESRIAEALHRIDELAEKLGLKSLGCVPLPEGLVVENSFNLHL